MKKLTLDFLGKDSVHYKNTIEVPDEVADAINDLIAGKKSTDKIFDLANEGTVNDFLSECVPECTAKLFRTAYGSMLLAQELQAHPIKKDMNDVEKKSIYNNAALEVSKKLNHQKNVSKNYVAQSEKMDENLKNAKAKLSETKKKVAEKLKGIKAKAKTYKAVFEGEQLKEKLAELTQKKEKLEAQLHRAEMRVEKLSIDKQFKADTKNYALGTAKSAYSDPQVVASFCSDNDLDPSFIYSKSLLQRYDWAFENPNPKYWKTYPNGKPTK